jgi:hypothetical protein
MQQAFSGVDFNWNGRLSSPANFRSEAGEHRLPRLRFHHLAGQPLPRDWSYAAQVFQYPAHPDAARFL